MRIIYSIVPLVTTYLYWQLHYLLLHTEYIVNDLDSVVLSCNLKFSKEITDIQLLKSSTGYALSYAIYKYIFINVSLNFSFVIILLIPLYQLIGFSCDSKFLLFARNLLQKSVARYTFKLLPM